MYLSCGFYFRQEKRIACYAENEQEWALFLNERNRIIYNDFAENAVVNVSRVFAVLWCIAQNIYRKGEQRTMKMIENEMK